MRAALYARFSSENQRYESIDAQLRCSRDYCGKKGYSIVRTYKDAAISGTSVAGREGFQQMIRDSMENIFDVIVFHKIDRAARNEIDYYSNISILEKNGIKYEYSAEGIDISTANGKLTEGIKVAVSAWYSRNLSMEVKKGKHETALQCKHNGGLAPLGYDVINQKYVINESEAMIVKKIFELRKAGLGYGKIIDYLNGHGYKTKRGGTFGKNSLHDILVNKKYIGYFVYNRTMKHNSHAYNPEAIEIPDAIPRIIDDDTFYEVQKDMKQYSSGGRHKAKAVYALSGKIFCSCGAPMYGYSSGNEKHKYYHYICKAKTYKRTGCNSPRIKKDFIEKKILDIILACCNEHRQEVIAEFQRLALNEDVNKEKDMLASSIKKQEAKLNRLLDFFTETGDKDIAARYKQEKDILASLKKEYSTKDINLCRVNSEQIERYLNSITSQSFNEKDIKDIFNAFIDRVTVYPDYIDIQLSIKVEKTMVALKRILSYPL